MQETLANLLTNPIVQGIIIGFLAAAEADWDAFKKWESVDQAFTYDWRRALWRWFKGVAIGAVGGFSVSYGAYLIR